MRNEKQIEFLHDAPDLSLKDISGNTVLLSSFWTKKPLLLAFTRHFGCTQCKEMLSEIVEGKERIKKAGLNIVVITQGTPESTAIFANEFAPGLTCLSDPERKAYEAFGLEKGNLFQTFLNPTVWKAVSSSKKKGFNIETPPPGQDAMQMSGVFIINTQGKVELPYYYDHIANHPPLDLLLSGVFSTSWDKAFDGPIGPGTK